MRAADSPIINGAVLGPPCPLVHGAASQVMRNVRHGQAGGTLRREQKGQRVSARNGNHLTQPEQTTINLDR